MKIDLHIHTKKILKSESEAREINDKNKFIEILKQAQIKIAAITNHNTFDITQFKLFQSEENFLLLPGVEYDVSIGLDNEGKKIRRQVNVIFSNESNSPEILEKIIKDNPSTTADPISIESFLDAFSNNDSIKEKVIFYLDYKRQKTSWRIEEAKQYFLNNSDFAVIFDAYNSKTHHILLSKQFNSLIGSDVMNWNEYITKDSKRLISTNLKINSFQLLRSIVMQGPETHLISNVKELKNTEINYSIKSIKKEIKNIRISNGVNVIFGPKATGKTELLTAICKKDEGKKILYKSENYESVFNEIINDNSASEIKVQENNIRDILDEILKYSEEKFNDFKNFRMSILNRSIYKFQDTKNLPKTEPSTKKYLNYANQSNEYLKTTLNFYNKGDIKLKKWQLLHSNIEEILRDLKLKYVKLISEYKSYKIIDKIKKEVSSLITSLRGEFSAPTTMGLFQKYERRKTLYNNLDKFQSKLEDQKLNTKSFHIPGGRKLNVIKEIIFLDPKNSKPFKTNDRDRLKIKKTNNLSKINSHHKMGLFQLSINNYLDNPKNSINEFKKMMETGCPLYIVGSYIVDENNNHVEASNGEKAFISLFNTLEDNNSANTFYLDEPGTYLGNKMIADAFIPKIFDLNRLSKRIFITTHRGSIGINTMPYNLIFRSIKKLDDSDVYRTYVGSFNESNLEEIHTGEKIELVNTLIDNFEGSKNQFEFRKEIYEYDD